MGQRAVQVKMATTGGTVTDLCQGLNQKYKATNLKPHTQYIFCVKANYDDRSATWSKPLAFTTSV